MKWNKEQEQIISTQTPRIFISGKAGTGKTQILAEWCTQQLETDKLQGPDLLILLSNQEECRQFQGVLANRVGVKALMPKLTSLPLFWMWVLGQIPNYHIEDVTLLPEDDQKMLLTLLSSETVQSLYESLKTSKTKETAILAPDPAIDAQLKTYEKLLKNMKVIDAFDPALLLLNLLGRNRDDIETILSRFSTLIVDDYHLLSDIDHAILNQISPWFEKIIFTTDPIYSDAKHKPLTTIALETQYRGLAYPLSKTHPLPEIVLGSETAIASFLEKDIVNLTHQYWCRLADIGIQNPPLDTEKAVHTHFNKAGIPIRKKASTSYFNKIEIKEFLAFARLFVNLKDDSALFRVLPGLGLDVDDIYQLKQLLISEKTSIYEQFTQFGLQCSETTQTTLDTLYNTITEIQNQFESDDASAHSILTALFEKTGFKAQLEGSLSLETADYIENIGSFLLFVEEEGGSLLELLYKASLFDHDDDSTPSGDALYWLTDASPKPLDALYYFGPWDEMSLYKAASKVKRRIVFVPKIEDLDTVLTVFPAIQQIIKLDDINTTPSKKITGLALLPAPIRTPIEAPFKSGQTIRHPQFGIGTIRHIKGQGTQTQLDITFETGSKTLLARYAHLERV